MPALESLHRRYHDQGVDFVSIHCRDQADPVRFLEEKRYSFRLLLDGDRVAKDYGVEGLPTFLVVDSGGTVVYRGSGYGPGMPANLASAVHAALRLASRSAKEQGDESPAARADH